MLYSKPEILLLDEPTNNLDISTRTFVTEYLKNYKGMVLIISHDIDFLNSIINKVMYIDKVTKKIAIYDDDYQVYEKKHTQELKLRECAIVHQEKEIKVLSDFVQKAQQASRTNHHLKRLGIERTAKLEKKTRSCKFETEYINELEWILPTMHRNWSRSKKARLF